MIHQFVITINSFTKHQLSAIVGYLGILTSLGLYGVVAAQAFITPLNKSPYDLVWATVYAAVFMLGGILYARGAYHWIVRLVCGGGAALLLVILFISPSAKALLGLGWISLLAVAIGDWALICITKDTTSRLERFLLSFGLGMGVLSMMIAILGSRTILESYLPWVQRIPRLLFLYPVVSLMLVLSLIFIPRWIRYWTSPIINYIEKLSAGNMQGLALGLGVGSILLIGPLFWALAPSIRYDALTYHLSAPVIYIRSRGIIPIPEAYNSYWAHYAEMLYTLGLILAGQPLPTLIHLSFGIAAAGMTFAMVRRFSGASIALLATVLFGSLPIMNYESATAYIDLFVTFYILCVYFSVLAWWQEGSMRWLVLGGIMAGFSIGVKLNAAVLLLPLAVGLLVAMGARYRALRPVVLGLLGFGLPSIMISAPWFIRDYLWTGNPIFPMVNNVFKSPLWDQLPNFYNVNVPDTSRLFRFISLPISLITSSHSAYYREGPNGSLGILPILFLPWLYLTSTNLKPKLRAYAGAVFAYLLATLFLMSTVSLLARYMLPLFPLLAFLASLNLHALHINLKTKLSPRGLLMLSLVLSLAYLWSTRLSLTLRGWQIPERYPVQVGLGFESEDGFLTRSITVYPAFQYLDRNTNGQVDVISVGNNFQLYTQARIHSSVLSAEVARLLGSNLSAEKLYQAIQSNRYEYLLIDWEEVKQFNLWGYNILKPAFLDKYARLVYAMDDKVLLYQILSKQEILAAQTASKNPVKNLLSNPGFEQVGPDNFPMAWEHYNQPELNQSGNLAHSGKAAIKAIGDHDFLYQQVPVVPGHLYTVGMWVRSEANDQVARLQILWRDENLVTVGVSSRLVYADNQWRWYELPASAPFNAQFARVFATVQEGNSAWIDDVCFAEGPTCK